MKLKDKVQFALDESRMLVMGVQVLLGFDFQIFLMRRFETMGAFAHELNLASTLLLLVAVILLLAPAARHRIVDDGHDSRALERFARTMCTWALLPFALSLGIECFVVVCRVVGPAIALPCGIVATVAALAAWYAVPFFVRTNRHSPEDSMEPASLNDKIRHVMTESRVVLPGTQALMGFQLVAVMQDGFDALPHATKLVHLAGLAALGLSVVFLMLPAAYHRIAEAGEISERLHRFASRSLIVSMVTLSLGLACDTFVVVEKSVGSTRVAFVAAGVWLVVSLGAWIGYTAFTRQREGGVRILHA